MSSPDPIRTMVAPDPRFGLLRSMPKAHANNLHIYYETHGSGLAPYLTILGGLGDSTRNWGLIARELSKNFTVIVPDTRGAGKTEKTDPLYSVELFAHDTTGFLDAVGIDKTHILGFSMGGMTAQAIAAHHPEYVDKLILVSSTAGKKRFAPQNPDVPHLMYGYEFSESHFSKTYGILFSKKFRESFDKNMFVKFKLSDPNPQSQACFLAQYEAVKNFDGAGLLDKIKCPTLILAGTDDGMIATDASQFLHEHIAGSKLLLYPECGHIPQMEQPQKFYTDVTDFLRG